MKHIDSALQDAIIITEVDGESYYLGGVGFSYGHGKDRAEADKRLYERKQSRTDSGERVPGNFSRRVFIKAAEDVHSGAIKESKSDVSSADKLAADLAGRLGKPTEVSPCSQGHHQSCFYREKMFHSDRDFT